MVYKFKKTRKREKHKLINKYVDKSCNNKCKINFLKKKKKTNVKSTTRGARESFCIFMYISFSTFGF